MCSSDLELGIEAQGHFFENAVETCMTASREDLFLCEAVPQKRKILPHGSGKQKDLLLNKSDSFANFPLWNIQDILSAKDNPSLVRLIKSEKKVRYGAFPCTGMPYYRHGFSLPDSEAEIEKCRGRVLSGQRRGIGERDVFKADFAQRAGASS